MQEKCGEAQTSRPTKASRSCFTAQGALTEERV